MQLALAKRVLHRATGFVCSVGDTVTETATDQAMAHGFPGSLKFRGMHRIALPNLSTTIHKKAHHGAQDSTPPLRGLIRALRSLAREHAQAFARFRADRLLLTDEIG